MNYIDNDDALFADEVHIATLSNKATVRLFDSSESARENYELIEDEFVEEPSRFVLSDNAILTWDETPSEEDEDAVFEMSRGRVTERVCLPACRPVKTAWDPDNIFRFNHNVSPGPGVSSSP